MPRPTHFLSRAFACGFALLAAGCAGVVDRPPSATGQLPVVPSDAGPAAPTTARDAGVAPGPSLAELGIAADSAARALTAFRISCPSLIAREDISALTTAGDWDSACSAAGNWPDRDGLGFFTTYFDPVVVGSGEAFATGYYEPQIAGSRTRIPGHAVPIYAVPPDLIEVDLGFFSQSLAGRRIRGRIANRKLVPYFDRAAIEEGALVGRGLEIAWAADPVDLFFLQIQGSGQLMLPDGTVMRIGYASQNGRDYVAVGKLLKERGLVTGPVTMQAIASWLKANPEQGRAVMRENKSYIFFTELRGAGPLGALGKPVSPRASVAAYPRFVPLGAPIVLAMDRPEADGLWVAQDTGGAIKGPNRFDTFWGAGDEAARIAGGMAARGRAWLLLPKARANRAAEAGHASSRK